LSKSLIIGISSGLKLVVMDSGKLRREIQGMDKIMETLDSIGTDCVGCTERTLVENIFIRLFVYAV